MAIAFVASTSAAVSGVGATTVTVNVPTGTANGHVLILVASTTISDTPATPSGWTLAAGPLETTATGSTPEMVVYRRVASSEPASYAVGGNTSIGRVAQMLAFSGVDTTTPLDATPTTAQGITTLADCPSITTVTNGAVILAIGLMDLDDVTLAAPSTYTLAETTNSAGAGADNGLRQAVAFKAQVTAGAENPGVFTGAGAGDDWGAITLALRPAGAGASLTATGAFTAQSASSAATVLLARSASASFTAQAAASSATAVLGHPATASFTAQSAASSATATVAGNRTATAAFQAQDASFQATATAANDKTLTAAFTAQSATMAATVSLPVDLPGRAIARATVNDAAGRVAISTPGSLVAVGRGGGSGATINAPGSAVSVSSARGAVET